ncbi:MAG TPA: preprotein translocase subunit YajC [Bryobacteraceae bacterium]|nr:preprotein translocase subunit YajC [Bryobacteraceae bacterium]
MFPAFFLQQQQSGAQALVFYGEIAAMILVVYFIVFRPMQRQKKQQQEMLSQLKAGDNVVTSGGIVGTITSVDAETIVLRVKPDNLKLQFSRNAVSAVVPLEGAK